MPVSILNSSAKEQKEEINMPAYWWECRGCGTKVEFPEACGSKGITHYIWDALIPSNWDQSKLVRKCANCSQDTLRITYIFPRKNQTHIQVKHMIGLGPFDDEYVPMIWETIPDGAEHETWIDFKYVNGRNIWGLNKPAVFNKDNMRELFKQYRICTGDTAFP
jgi:hypothetical protein